VAQQYTGQQPVDQHPVLVMKTLGMIVVEDAGHDALTDIRSF
jgi:hypothetical protein